MNATRTYLSIAYVRFLDPTFQLVIVPGDRECDKFDLKRLGQLIDLLGVK